MLLWSSRMKRRSANYRRIISIEPRFMNYFRIIILPYPKVSLNCILLVIWLSLTLIRREMPLQLSTFKKENTNTHRHRRACTQSLMRVVEGCRRKAIQRVQAEVQGVCWPAPTTPRTLSQTIYSAQFPRSPPLSGVWFYFPLTRFRVQQADGGRLG